MESALNYAFIDDDLIKKPVIIEVNDFSEEEKRNNELECFGSYYSNHPASIYQNVFKLENINSYLFKNVKCVILIERITKLKTKKGDDMAFLSGSDDTGVSDFTVFPKNFDKLNNVNNGDLVEILGTVSKRFDKTSIIVNNIRKVG